MSEKPKPGLSAFLEFSANGYLKTVYLQADTDADAAVLERALNRLIKPDHAGWLKRLIKWGQS